MNAGAETGGARQETEAGGGGRKRRREAEAGDEGSRGRLGLKTPGYEKEKRPCGATEVRRGWCPGSVWVVRGGGGGPPARSQRVGSSEPSD